jgi:hypothetical protein
MKVFLIAFLFIFFSIQSHQVFSQNSTATPSKWLSKQLNERKNLHVLNKDGYNELIKILSTNEIKGLILGYYENDSFFVYSKSIDKKVESCITVQLNFLSEFKQNKKRPSIYSNVKLYNESTIWNYTPLTKNKQTLIVLFNKKSSKRYRKLYNTSAKELQENNFDVKLIFTDYSL